MSFKFLLVIAGLCASTALDAQDGPASVCAQLAPQIGLKAEGGGLWRANMLGLGATLFGGSTGATFQILPVDGSTPDQGFDKACVQNGAEMSCGIVGPARIVIGTKKGNATADVKAGEKAEVGMKGRYITCRQGK